MLSAAVVIGALRVNAKSVLIVLTLCRFEGERAYKIYVASMCNITQRYMQLTNFESVQV